MIEWLYFILLAFSAFFFLFAWYSNIPAFYALSGVFLVFTSWQVTADGGIWRETVTEIVASGDNYTITKTYDVNSTISVALADSPVAWGFNSATFFMGLLFVAYSIGEGIKSLRY